MGSAEGPADAREGVGACRASPKPAWRCRFPSRPRPATTSALLMCRERTRSSCIPGPDGRDLRTPELGTSSLARTGPRRSLRAFGTWPARSRSSSRIVWPQSADKRLSTRDARAASTPVADLERCRRPHGERLHVPSFSTGGETYLRRLTLIVSAAIIDAVFFPAPEPGSHAGEVLAGLKRTAMVRA